MNNALRTRSLILVTLLIVSSLILVKPSFAQSGPKPPLPEFTVNFVDSSYDVPTTTTSSTDLYTGKQVVTAQAGYHIQNASFIVQIRNPPFTPYTSGDHQVSLYYGIQVKGHYSPNWGNLTFYYSDHPYLAATDENYTTVVFALSGNNASYYQSEGSTFTGAGWIGGSYGGQVDFSVMSAAGYYITVPDNTNPLNVRHPYRDEFVTLQTSSWSDTQTVDIIAKTDSNQSLILPGLIVLGFAVALATWALVIRQRRIRGLALKQNGA